MFDHNNIELEFYFTDNCKVESIFDNITGKNKKVIQFMDTQTLNVVAYQTWSADTLFINNTKKRRFFVRTITDLVKMIDSFNNEQPDSRKYMPSCVFKTEDGTIYYVIVERFELTNSIDSSNTSGIDIQNNSILTLVVDNNFRHTDFHTLNTKVDAIPDGDYSNVNFNMSGFTYAEIDNNNIFSKNSYYGPGNKTTNVYNDGTNKISFLNNLTNDHSGIEQKSATKSYNYILRDQCIIKNLDNNELEVTIKNPKMITQYQDWSKVSNHFGNKLRTIKCISASEFVSHVDRFNNYMTIYTSKGNAPLEFLFFKPTVYVEAQGKSLLSVIDRFEIVVNEENEFLKMVLLTEEMEVSDGVNSQVHKVELENSTEFENIFMNIDPKVEPDLSSVNHFQMLTAFQMIGLDLLELMPNKNETLTFMGYAPKNIDFDFNTIYPAERQALTEEKIQDPNKYIEEINASELWTMPFAISSNTTDSEFSALYNTLEVKTMKAHRFKLSTKSNYDVPLFMNFLIQKSETFDMSLNIYDSGYRRITRATESVYGFRLSGMNEYIIEITGRVDDGLSSDLTKEKTGQYYFAIVPSQGGETPFFIPTEEMEVTPISMKELNSTEFFDTVTLTNKGFGMGLGSNPAKRYLLDLGDEPVYSLLVNPTQSFPNISLAILEVKPMDDEFYGEDYAIYRVEDYNVFIDQWPLEANKTYLVEVSSKEGTWNLNDENHSETFTLFVGNVLPAFILPTRSPIVRKTVKQSAIKSRRLPKVSQKTSIQPLRNASEPSKPIMRSVRYVVSINDENQLLINGKSKVAFQRGTEYILDMSNPALANKYIEIVKSDGTSPDFSNDQVTYSQNGNFGTAGSTIAINISLGSPLVDPLQLRDAEQVLTSCEIDIFGERDTAVANTLPVTVVADQILIDGRAECELLEGYQYTFDLSDASCSGLYLNITSARNIDNDNVIVNRSSESPGTSGSYLKVTWSLRGEDNSQPRDYLIESAGIGYTSALIRVRSSEVSSLDPGVIAAIVAIVFVVLTGVGLYKIFKVKDGRVALEDLDAISEDVARVTAQEATGKFDEAQSDAAKKVAKKVRLNLEGIYDNVKGKVTKTQIDGATTTSSGTDSTITKNVLFFDDNSSVQFRQDWPFDEPANQKIHLIDNFDSTDPNIRAIKPDKMIAINIDGKVNPIEWKVVNSEKYVPATVNNIGSVPIIGEPDKTFTIDGGIHVLEGDTSGDRFLIVAPAAADCGLYYDYNERKIVLHPDEHSQTFLDKYIKSQNLPDPTYASLDDVTDSGTKGPETTAVMDANAAIGQHIIYETNIDLAAGTDPNAGTKQVKTEPTYATVDKQKVTQGALANASNEVQYMSLDKLRRAISDKRPVPREGGVIYAELALDEMAKQAEKGALKNNNSVKYTNYSREEIENLFSDENIERYIDDIKSGLEILNGKNDITLDTVIFDHGDGLVKPAREILRSEFQDIKDFALTFMGNNDISALQLSFIIKDSLLQDLTGIEASMTYEPDDTLYFVDPINKENKNGVFVDGKEVEFIVGDGPTHDDVNRLKQMADNAYYFDDGRVGVIVRRNDISDAEKRQMIKEEIQSRVSESSSVIRTREQSKISFKPIGDRMITSLLSKVGTSVIEPPDKIPRDGFTTRNLFDNSSYEGDLFEQFIKIIKGFDPENELFTESFIDTNDGRLKDTLLRSFYDTIENFTYKDILNMTPKLVEGTNDFSVKIDDVKGVFMTKFSDNLFRDLKKNYFNYIQNDSLKRYFQIVYDDYSFLQNGLSRPANRTIDTSIRKMYKTLPLEQFNKLFNTNEFLKPILDENGQQIINSSTVIKDGVYKGNGSLNKDIISITLDSNGIPLYDIYDHTGRVQTGKGESDVLNERYLYIKDAYDTFNYQDFVKNKLQTIDIGGDSLLNNIDRFREYYNQNRWVKYCNEEAVDIMDIITESESGKEVINELGRKGYNPEGAIAEIRGAVGDAVFDTFNGQNIQDAIDFGIDSLEGKVDMMSDNFRQAFESKLSMSLSDNITTKLIDIPDPESLISPRDNPLLSDELRRKFANEHSEPIIREIEIHPFMP